MWCARSLYSSNKIDKICVTNGKTHKHHKARTVTCSWISRLFGTRLCGTLNLLFAIRLVLLWLFLFGRIPQKPIRSLTRRKPLFGTGLRERAPYFHQGEGQKLRLPLKPAIFNHFVHMLWVAKSQLGSVDTVPYSRSARTAYICLGMNSSNRSPAKCVGQQRESAWVTRSFWGARVRKGMNL